MEAKQGHRGHRLLRHGLGALWSLIGTKSLSTDDPSHLHSPLTEELPPEMSRLHAIPSATWEQTTFLTSEPKLHAVWFQDEPH